MNKEKCIKILNEKIEEIKKEANLDNVNAFKINNVLNEIMYSLKSIEESKNVIAHNIFKRTISALYNYSDKQVESLYKIYYFEMIKKLVKSKHTKQVVPKYDDLSSVYVFEDDKIYSHDCYTYIPFYDNCEEIKEHNNFNQKNSEYLLAIEMREKFEQGKNYIDVIY